MVAKSLELKKQLEILAQVHSRRIDRKQAAIENLQRYMKESEEQYTSALQSHFINIDTLIELQNSRLETLRAQFDADMAILDTEFNTEKLKAVLMIE